MANDRPLSASQLETWLDCQRKWSFRYIDRLPTPPDPSAVLGTRCHAILEAYLRDGVEPNGLERIDLPAGERSKPRTAFPGQIVQAALPFLPPPGVAAAEERSTYISPASKWTVIRDMRYRRSGVAVVGDLKTTSDFQWAKTPDVLATDVQAMLYAAAEFASTNDPEVELRWLYVRTKGQPAAREVVYRATRDHVSAQMQWIDEVALEVHAAYEAKAPTLSLPPTLSTCEKFGGCPHRLRCNVSLSERLRYMTVPQESLAEFAARKVAERDARQAPAPAPAAPVAAPAPAWTPPVLWKPGDAENPTQTYYRQAGAPWSVIASQALPPVPPEIAASYDTLYAAPDRTTAQAGTPSTSPGLINPPGAPVAAASPLPAPASAVPTTPAAPANPDGLDALDRTQLKALAVQRGLVDSSTKFGADALRKLLREGPKAPPAPPAVAPPSSAPPPPVWTPPATPPGVTVSVLPAGAPLPAPTMPPPAPVAAPSSHAPTGPFPPPDVASGYTLCIDCSPRDGDGVRHFADLFLHVHGELCRLRNVSDYRLIGYGEGQGLLSAGMAEFISLMDFGPETTVVVDSSRPEAGVCLSALEAKAGRIYRAAR